MFYVEIYKMIEKYIEWHLYKFSSKEEIVNRKIKLYMSNIKNITLRKTSYLYGLNP